MREMPCSLEAEMGALGALVLDPMRLFPVATGSMALTGEAFSDVGHRVVFEGIRGMAEAGRLAVLDMLSLAQWLRDKASAVVGAGGAKDFSPVLERLVEATPTSAHGEYYLEIVRDKWVLRRALEELQRAALEGFEAENGEAFARGLPERLAAAALPDRADEVTNGDLLEVELARWEAAARKEAPAIGLPTPWERLTEMMCGIEEGVTIIAGRPSQGKSTLEDEISTGLALSGVPVARVQLDMNRRKSLARATCRIAGVSLPKLKHGFARRDQLAKVREAVQTVRSLPMYLNDKDYSLRGICSWARAMKLKHDIKMLTVDHVGLVQVDGSFRGNDNSRISLVSSTLKALGAELGVAVVLLSQLSRGMEKESRRPQLSDLRDSGTLEQDAAKVIFVYREYRPKLLAELETDSRRPVWVELLKNQDGETGLLPFWLWKKYFRFELCPASDHEEEVKTLGHGKDLDDVEA